MDIHIINWVKKLGAAWVNKKPNLIPPLFADKFQYFESPFEKPYTSKEDLIKLWSDVPKSQKNISFDFEVIFIKDNIGLIHWCAAFTRIPFNKKAWLDGIFYLEFDKNNLCILFKQWWVSK